MRMTIDLSDEATTELESRLAKGGDVSSRKRMAEHTLEVALLGEDAIDTECKTPMNEWVSNRMPEIDTTKVYGNVYTSERVEVVFDDGTMKKVKYIQDADTGRQHWYNNVEPLAWRYL